MSFLLLLDEIEIEAPIEGGTSLSTEAGEAITTEAGDGAEEITTEE